jgi:hypothetical protein
MAEVAPLDPVFWQPVPLVALGKEKEIDVVPLGEELEGMDLGVGTEVGDKCYAQPNSPGD